MGAITERSFPLPRAGNAALAILFVLDAAMIGAAAWIILQPGEPFHVQRIIGLGALMAMSALFSWIMLGLLRSRVVIKPEGLMIDVPLYRRTEAWKVLKLEEAEILRDPLPDTWKLKWRTNGIGLPGYMVGWFTTRTGEKVFAARTGNPVVRIPTTGRHHLLLSVDDPQAFVDALHGL
jgi:hypothetical protein